MRRQPEASFTTSLWLGSQRSLATTPLRGSPPVRPVAFRGEVLERRSDGLGVRSRAAAEAELPQFLRRLVVAVDHLVDIVDVELARSVALDRLRDMLHQSGDSASWYVATSARATRRLSFDPPLRSVVMAGRAYRAD
jgi:hypothetical protein